jgi:hypothetical protein
MYVFFIWPRSRLRVTSKLEEGAKPAVLVSYAILGWTHAFLKARACWSLVPAFARDLAFREASDDRCAPCLLKSKAPVPLPAQLNVEADSLATDYNAALTHPLPEIPFDPTTKI